LGLLTDASSDASCGSGRDSDANCAANEGIDSGIGIGDGRGETGHKGNYEEKFRSLWCFWVRQSAHRIHTPSYRYI